MIQNQVDGDLLNFPYGLKIIAHQANTECIFGAGIARSIAERYPECIPPKYSNVELGGIMVCSTSEDKRIVHMFCQSLKRHSLAGIPTCYSALAGALLELRKFLVENQLPKRVGVPYMMGCGLGGGNWEVYKKILDEYSDDVDVILVKY